MTQEIINEFLYSNETNLSFLLIVFATAFILGAIHAMGPGHGKSLMAAYLIGSKGRIRDTLILALTLTISHIFSVIILGFIALWVTNFFLPEAINKWIGLFSGILVVAIGVWLFITRLRDIKKARQSGTSLFFDEPKTAHQHEHEHTHNHTHDHGVKRPHHHFDHRFSLWNNILLGISGGIIPCPKAIVILLLAISLQKIAFGIIIIVFFSLGLSCVLIALGIIMLKASHLIKGRLKSSKIRLLPIAGSILIFIVGVIIIIRSSLVF